MIEQLKSLHALWCKLTGQELRYQPCERILWDWVNNGFTEDDLSTLLEFMLWQNRKREPKYRDKIQFHRIMGDLEVANSRLGEANAWKRNKLKAATDKAKTVAAFRGTPVEPETNGATRTWGEVLQSVKLKETK